MRIVKMLGIALAAILALGVVAAAGASANEWLLNGKVLTEELAVKSKGTLKLTDSKTTVGSVTVECMGNDEGTVGPGKSDKVTKVTGLAGELTVTCTTVSGTCSSPKAMAVGLPWATELTSSTTDLVTTATAGWEVECTVLGVKAVDTCTGMLSPKVENTTGGVNVKFEGATSGKATCSQKKEETGTVEGTDLLEQEGLTVS